MSFRNVLRVLSVALSICLTSGLWAQDISLTSRDGSIEIQGNFLSFDGEFYRVETDLGVLTIDSSGVICEGPGCPSIDGYFAQIRISSDPRASKTLIPALITAFASRNGYALAISTPRENQKEFVLTDSDTGVTAGEFILRATNAGDVFSDLNVEQADLGVSLRKATHQERELAVEAGVGDLSDPLRARVIALDATVPLVSRSNLLEALSFDDIAQIYAGQIKNWAELGGRDAPIVPHLLEQDLGTESLLAETVFATVDVTSEEGLVLHGTPAALIAAIEADPYAIGLGRMSEGGSVKTLGLTAACGFEAQAISADIKTKDYPLTQPVFLYSPARRLPKLAREFQKFSLSPTAQLIVARTRFSDQAVDALSFRDQGRRFSNAISRAGGDISLKDIKEVTAEFQGAKRLTLGFRFTDGSTALDAQSRSNVLLLADLLEAGVFDGKELVFAGFSDGQGDAQVNRNLSERRAKQVLNAVHKALSEAFVADRVTLGVKGFGEAMPLACDDVAWGRSLNRRVEIWIRDRSKG